ncbi:MAG: hypothetical protein BYD32DRAFT_478836 [Podila humilis]|nr:MAG: hypothetical protein BYD32DRAFT_478836 [Podila humilis]
MKAKEVVAFSTSDNKRSEIMKLSATKFSTRSHPHRKPWQNVSWNELVSSVASYGTFVLLALPESLVAIFRQVSVTGSLTGGCRTVLEMLDFAAKHNIRLWIEKREMKDVNEVVNLLTGDVGVKAKKESGYRRIGEERQRNQGAIQPDNWLVTAKRSQ